jgi:hypothetical protein
MQTFNRNGIVAMATEDSGLTKRDWDAGLVLMDDVRNELLEVKKDILTALAAPPHTALQAQLDALAQAITNPPDTGVGAQLDEVIALLTPPLPPSKPWWVRWQYGVILAALMGIGGGWIGGQWPQQQAGREAKLMRQMDTLLVERYAQLPTAVQQGLSSLYKQFDFQDPGQRKRGTK